MSDVGDRFGGFGREWEPRDAPYAEEARERRRRVVGRRFLGLGAGTRANDAERRSIVHDGRRAGGAGIVLVAGEVHLQA